MAAMTPALEVKDLTVSVQLGGGRRATVVSGVNFSIPVGSTLGLVGESGSGKSMTSLAIMGLLPNAAQVDRGEVRLDGRNLLALSESEWAAIRGSQIGMILQDPMTALDPCFTIGSQLAEPLRQHRRLRGRELGAAMVGALEQVHLPAAGERLEQYPHQLSGGMRQRVTSAIALAGRPRVLIADEPTTALDVTTQARYLQLLRELQQNDGFALLLIAHDLLLVRHVCASVVVMYAGEVVEAGPSEAVFNKAQHPYTRALINAIPVLGDTVELESIEGQAPEIGEEVAGCRFAARCPLAADICRKSAPALSPRGGDGRMARCWATEPGGWSS